MDATSNTNICATPVVAHHQNETIAEAASVQPTMSDSLICLDDTVDSLVAVSPAAPLTAQPSTSSVITVSSVDSELPNMSRSYTKDSDIFDTSINLPASQSLPDELFDDDEPNDHNDTLPVDEDAFQDGKRRFVMFDYPGNDERKICYHGGFFYYSR